MFDEKFVLTPISHMQPVDMLAPMFYQDQAAL